MDPSVPLLSVPRAPFPDPFYYAWLVTMGWMPPPPGWMPPPYYGGYGYTMSPSPWGMMCPPPPLPDLDPPPLPTESKPEPTLPTKVLAAATSPPPSLAPEYREYHDFVDFEGVDEEDQDDQEDQKTALHHGLAPSPLVIIDNNKKQADKQAEKAPTALPSATAPTPNERPQPKNNVKAARHQGNPPATRCVKCAACPPFQPGMRYCQPCFHKLPFCSTNGCKRRTDDPTGYCRECYQNVRQKCVECEDGYYWDGSGLCEWCQERAEPIQPGECRQWWVEWVERDDEHVPYRVVCRANTRRLTNEFCHDCWQELKARK